MNRLNCSLTDQVVVFRPEVFPAAYRALPYRVWRVVGGFGASPMTQGRSLTCRSLLAGAYAKRKDRSKKQSHLGRRLNPSLRQRMEHPQTTRAVFGGGHGDG